MSATKTMLDAIIKTGYKPLKNMIVKPHYVFKGGIWWVFKSRYECRIFREVIKQGGYNHKLEPRQTVCTEMGLL